MSDSIEHRFKRDFNAVGLSISQVDSCRGDPRNILGLVIYHDLDTALYRIAIKAGVMKESYSHILMVALRDCSLRMTLGKSVV